MCDSDSSEDQSDQPCAKKMKLHYGILQSHQVNNSKRERQKKYRERNRDKLKHREAERRKRIQSLQSIIGPSTSSNSNIMEVNNEEPVTAISSTLQNKRDRQKRYREKNREKLSQREAERRRRLQNAESIIELHTSPSVENREIITEPIIIIDEMALTNAERQKLYREKMKTQNPAKYMEIKANNAERNRKRKKIKECSKEVKEIKRKQWRTSQTRLRNKKKFESDHEVNDAQMHTKTYLEKKKLHTRLARQRKHHEETIKKSNLQTKSLKKNLPNDMENYMRYHIMGSVSQVRMKPGCIPHKFECQPDRTSRTSNTVNRPYISKKRKIMALEGCEKQESSMVEHLDFEEIASTSSDNEDTSGLSDYDSDATDCKPSRQAEKKIKPGTHTKLTIEIVQETEFRCHSCSNEICGSRYACMECPDYSICAKCEFLNKHATHYMLRIPNGKLQTEAKAILRKLRKEFLLMESKTEEKEQWSPSGTARREPTLGQNKGNDDENGESMIIVKEEIEIKQEDPLCNLTSETSISTAMEQDAVPTPDALQIQDTSDTPIVPRKKRRKITQEEKASLSQVLLLTSDTSAETSATSKVTPATSKVTGTSEGTSAASKVTPATSKVIGTTSKETSVASKETIATSEVEIELEEQFQPIIKIEPDETADYERVTIFTHRKPEREV